MSSYITGTGEGESIKNDESSRVLVAHPRLLDVGFLRYLNARSESGAERLFDLKAVAHWETDEGVEQEGEPVC